MRIRGILLSALLLSTPALAADKILKIPLADVLAMPEAKQKLQGGVTFHLSDSKDVPSGEVVGVDVTNKKTNAFNKPKEFACRWAALSALISLEAAAIKKGATAVVDLVSYYRKAESRDPVTFDCHVGALMVGVALKGRYLAPPGAGAAAPAH